MKKELYTFGVAALSATTLYAQSPLESSHCRLDSVIVSMIDNEYSRSIKQALNYDANNYLTSMDLLMKMNGEGWMLRERTRYVNNANGMPVEIYGEYFDNEWLIGTKSTQEYDTRGNCTLVTEYTYDMETQQYILMQTKETQYDSQDRVQEENNTYYVDNQIYNIYRTSYEYGTWGVSVELKSVFSYGAWSETEKTVYTYDSKGQLISWDCTYPAGGLWYGMSKQTFAYNDQGQMISSDYYNYGNNEPYLSTHSEYAYDAAGNQTVIEMWDGDGFESEKQEFGYDAHNDLVSEKMYMMEYDWETGERLGLQLHETIDYYYECLSSNRLDQVQAERMSQGCQWIDGQMRIVRGNSIYDLQGRKLQDR